jgi:2,4-dienoyl-CoA reductase-like NADH-dependent reductase (Old Yellow Enzyme family)
MSEKSIFILHIRETRILAVRFKHVRRFKAADGYFRAGEMRLYATLLKAIESVESPFVGSGQKVRLEPHWVKSHTTEIATRVHNVQECAVCAGYRRNPVNFPK